MEIGIPKEIKDHEYRVGATPAGVAQLTARGHEVRVQSGAGARIGFGDELYRQAGALVVDGAERVYAESEMILKVKEPQPAEYELLQPQQLLFCYLHLAPEPQLTAALLDRRVTGVAFETVTDAKGQLPLLTPMSEIAGRLSVQAGAQALQPINGGRGVLLSGAPGVPPARVLILGGGVVGTQAARIALGMGAEVTLLDIDLARLRYLDDLFALRVKTAYSDPATLADLLRENDLLIGAVLLPGARAPHLVSRAMLRTMLPGSAIVDVAIDQGGCVESARPTTHSHPMYVEQGVVHYCVANMPAAAARTATQALALATLPYALRIADLGWEKAAARDPGLAAGLNTAGGQLVHPALRAAA